MSSSKLTVGIVGLPNVGKSTLFNALTKQSVSAENYPFCTVDPSVGIVPVPDERLEALNIFSKSKKKIPAVIEFVDIAGLVKGASEGEGLGNKFLSHIREVDAIAQVVRIFEDSNIIHVHGQINPVDDIRVINLELILADLATVQKRRDNLARDVKRCDKEAVEEMNVIQKVLQALESENPASSVVLEEKEQKFFKSLHLLSAKPVLYALNKKAGGKNLDETNDPRFTASIDYLKSKNWNYVIIDAAIENELKDLNDEEKAAFREELSAADGIADLIKESYKTLKLMTFFTTGEDETRAWTIKQNSTAPEAGTAIHNDFKDKFIRAEVIPWNSLLEAGSYAAAREKGLLRTEGREYIVKDGDTIEFKI